MAHKLIALALGVILACLTAEIGRAGPGGAGPAGAGEPRMCTASLADGKLHIRWFFIGQPVNQEAAIKRKNEQGEWIIQKTLLERRSVVEQALTLDADLVRAVDTDGTAISAERLRELLQKEAPVLVVSGTDRVEPRYLSVMKKGLPVLLLPVPLEAGYGYYGAAPVAPPSVPAPPEKLPLPKGSKESP